MPLFELSRNNSKSDDMKLAKKSKVVKKAVPTIKGGNSLLDTITEAQRLVTSALGKHKDEFVLIQDEETLSAYIDNSIANNVIDIDTETTGLDPILDDIAGICIYTPNEKGAYIPINHVSYITNMHVPNQLEIDVIQRQFERLIDSKLDILMHNSVFDIRVLRNKVGLHNIYCTWDTYLAQRLLNENEKDNSLKMLHRKYVLNGDEEAFKFDTLFKGIPFTLIPLQTAVLYAANDPKITYELYDYQRQYLRADSEREDMRKIYWHFTNIEMPCVDATAKMENNGVLFDFEYNEKLKVMYHKLLDEREADFHKVCNKYKKKIDAYREKHDKLDNPINIKSAQQLNILLYDILGCDLFYDKYKNKYVQTTSEDHLKTLDNDVARAILSYREFSTIVSTFIDKLPNCVTPTDGRIRCSFNQYGTDTGRFSSSDPNLQNIPSHDKNIRKMFVASPGYVMMSSDFSQQEPKCLAALCRMQGKTQMYDTFMQGKDLYSEIASKAFNKPYDECREFNADGTTNKEGKERRSQAKSILLGVLYGRGVASIAEQLNCSTDTAQAIKDSVFKGFPAIKQFEQDSLAMAEELGYVTTISGRKRRLPDLNLDEYEFSWVNNTPKDDDLLDFDSELDDEVPERIIRKYTTRLHNAKYKDRPSIIKQAREKDGIIIIDNGGKIAKATRQTVNSRIQGSAADLTKLAMIELNNSKRLQELGFRLLIQVHDELIAECPEENMKECSKLLADTMSSAAEKLLEMPIKCDVTVTREWYGEEIEV